MAENATESMKDYEKELERSFRTINEGDIVSGTVIAVSEEDVTAHRQRNIFPMRMHPQALELCCLA